MFCTPLSQVLSSARPTVIFLENSSATGPQLSTSNNTSPWELLCQVLSSPRPTIILPENRSVCRQPEESLFYGREIPTHIFTRWADHSMMEAVRLMVRAALSDALNQRFVLLSETCLPLYPPTVIYQQLMHEHRSRIDACPGNTSETDLLETCVPSLASCSVFCARDEHVFCALMSTCLAVK